MAQTTHAAKRPAAQTDATPSAEPVFTVRFGNVSVAVFAKQAKAKDGGTFDTFHTSLRRSYRDDSGAWRQTHVLGADDLLPAGLALQRAFEFIAERKRQ
jgi:hypothetical protein